MKIENMVVFDSPYELPTDWDSVTGDNIYMKKDFLCFMHDIDKCRQKYHIFYNSAGKIDTVFMTYVRKKYNLLMFTKLKISIKMTFVYVPLSVTRSGINEDGERYHDAIEYIKSLKGYKIILNSENESLSDFASGLTCPKCILQINWSSFEEYMSCLRSGYRHRYNKAMHKAQALEIEYLSDNRMFDNELYSMYEQVYNKSKVKIEKLPIEFFRGSFFKIFVVKDKSGKRHGFVQLLENGDELIFEFVGIDYKTNSIYDTYQNMLLNIIKYGIENGFKTIDFGQTADDTKLKLGSEYTYLYAHVHHSLAPIHFICKKLAPKIEYKPLATNFNVFKSEVKE